MNDLTIASIASIQQRESTLKKTLETIIDQFDIVNVYLNGYKNTPTFLQHKKIKIFDSANYKNIGDSGKFFPLQDCTGYLFTLDDDLSYPSNYVDTIVTKIQQYQHNAFICVHGNKLPKNTKLTSYYQDKQGIHFAKSLEQDLEVDIPGTGTLAFHSSLHQVNMKDFPLPNMSDIWLYKIASEKKIPVVAIKRKNLWITPLITGEDQHSIYNKTHKNDRRVTQIINEITINSRASV